MTYLSEIEALKPGHKCVFFGRERTTPWAMMTVEVRTHPDLHPDDLGPCMVDASYYLQGVKHFLHREFMESRYAAEWLDGHLIRYMIEVKAPCTVCSQPCDFGSRGDGPATQEFGLDGSSWEFCSPACLKAWEMEA